MFKSESEPQMDVPNAQVKVVLTALWKGGEGGEIRDQKGINEDVTLNTKKKEKKYERQKKREIE
jgi:hypothetical protein